MALTLDPSKIKGRYALAAVIALVFESLFIAWFASASNSYERIAAGALAAVVLLAFLYMTLSNRMVAIDPGAKKLLGKWEFESVSQKGTRGTGNLSISHSGSNLVISGTLDEKGEQIGTFNSEVVRVNENRLIFYYVLRDTKKYENMDAVSIVVFDPNEPNELNGDWIVASKTPRHGSIKYRRAKSK